MHLLKIVAAAFCAAMLAVVGYLALFVMPEEGRHREVNAQWAKDRDVAFASAEARTTRSDGMISTLRATFPQDFAAQAGLLEQARENPSLVVRERVQIDIVRNMVRSHAAYTRLAGPAALRDVVKTRRDMLAAMMATGAISQCASMFTDTQSTPLPNDERLLEADAAHLKAQLAAEAQGSSSPAEYGEYGAADDQALRAAIASIVTDIPDPAAPFQGRPDMEACRLGILRDDARLLLPDGGVFERTAIASLPRT